MHTHVCIHTEAYTYTHTHTHISKDILVHTRVQSYTFNEGKDKTRK